MKKSYWILLGFIIVAFIVYRVVSIFLDKPAEERVPPVVRTMTVGETSRENVASYPGEVRGKYETGLSFQVSGKIIRRDVNLGDAVKAGQVLMEIDPKDINEKLRAAQAAHRAAATQALLASENYERYESLYRQEAVSTMVRDQYRTQHEAAEAQLAEAAANLSAAENELSYTVLVADHDGSIAAITGEVGQVVAAGTPVITMVQDDGREIEIHVPENHVGAIHPGDPATITFWALGDVTAHGRVSEISTMADSVTRTYKVRVAVDSFPRDARLGMTAKVELRGKESGSILVPQSAIYQRGDVTQVWLVEDGKARLRDVKASSYEGDKVKITEGLNQGDIVVTGGINKIAEGEEVRMEGSVFK